MKELVKDKKIYLGYANGWNKKRGDIYIELRKIEIPGTSKSTDNGRCDHEHSFDVELDGEIIKVTYSVDSGD
jgi:hypothetical protein